MKYAKKPASLTKNRLFSMFAVCYLPMLIGILLISHYGEHLLKQQSIRYNHNTLSLQLATIDTELSHISNYLASFLLNEEGYQKLQRNPSDVDTPLSICNAFTDYLNTYETHSTLFFYLPDQDILIYQTSSYDTFRERRSMRDYIRKICPSQETPHRKIQSTGWTLIQQDQQNYLLQVMEYQNIYVGAWSICQYLFSDFQSLETTTSGTLVLSNAQGIEIPLFSTVTYDRSLTQADDYVTIPVDSAKNNFRLSLCIPEKYILNAFAWFQYMALALALLTILFLSILLLFTWRQMVAPLIRMIAAMKAVQEGDFDTTLPIPETGDEFAELTETFNYMISQIHDLKIQVYEEKLHQVYAELQYLTLQIKPHFFLNCLNLLYSLGVSGRSALVAEFSSTLMKYFRYLFKSSNTMVTVAEEVSHVNNYLHVQQMRFQNDLEPHFEVEEQTKSMRIPVLVLHTFVENVFKHAYKDQQKMQLWIRAKYLREQGTSLLLLEVQDNGQGFSPEALNVLNHPARDTSFASKEGTHIGITNVRQRLFHFYGERMTLTFRNLADGGCVTLCLPQTDFLQEELTL